MNTNDIFFPMSPAIATPPMSDEDGVNLLIMMNDNVVRRKVGEAFTAQMQNSRRVEGTFFSKSDALLAPLPSALNDWVGQVASSVIALALAQCSSHGFSKTVKADKAQSFLNNSLTPNNSNFTSLAISNYQNLFPNYCSANNINFGAFLNGSYGPAAHWGSALAACLSSNSYITQEMMKMNPAADQGGWYQVFYANVYKVQCLNAAQVQGVLDAWAPYLQGKQIPNQIVSWTVYDHMVAGCYSEDTFMEQVQSAVAVSHGRKSVIYGEEVNDWLGNNRGLGGFINGPTDHNVEHHGGCGCFVPGTPILMADGTSKPIETVQADDVVISRNGEHRKRSPQDVRWHIEEHELFYGINEYPPFFNASHPFMTIEGWKSMSPRASRRINPDLDVSQLKVGDVLLQIESIDPLRYREVRIEKITEILAKDAPSLTIHSLHLAQDNPGYHANGFLVAVNYPQLREDHFVKAFAGITEAERKYLRRHFEPLVPFLRRGLGNYVSEILLRALGAPSETPPLAAQ